MRQDRLDECKALCEQFLQRAKEWEEAIVPPSGHTWTPFAPAQSGALRRTSMELTRALAILRRPDNV
jgi:hypothetical protein